MRASVFRLIRPFDFFFFFLLCCHQTNVQRAVFASHPFAAPGAAPVFPTLLYTLSPSPMHLPWPLTTTPLTIAPTFPPLSPEAPSPLS